MFGFQSESETAPLVAQSLGGNGFDSPDVDNGGERTTTCIDTNNPDEEIEFYNFCANSDDAGDQMVCVMTKEKTAACLGTDCTGVSAADGSPGTGTPEPVADRIFYNMTETTYWECGDSDDDGELERIYLCRQSVSPHTWCEFDNSVCEECIDDGGDGYIIEHPVRVPNVRIENQTFDTCSDEQEGDFSINPTLKAIAAELVDNKSSTRVRSKGLEPIDPRSNLGAVMNFLIDSGLASGQDTDSTDPHQIGCIL